MGRFRCLEEVARSGVVAILRKVPAEAAVPLVQALYDGGIRVLELTVESRGALANLEKVADAFGGQIVVGAGTVLDPAAVRSAVDAGAEFIVTPTLNVKVIEAAHRYGKPVFPGAFTPTEILTAFEAGAEAVKVFPIKTLGVDYLRQLKGPLGHIPLMPTGGVDASNAGSFIKAGALAVGVGGSLVDAKAVAEGRFDLLTRRAEELVAAVAEARREQG